MKRYVYILIIGIFCIFSPLVFAYTIVHWKSTGVLANVLLESDINNLYFYDIKDINNINYEVSTCGAYVKKPDIQEDPIMDHNNYLYCSIINYDNSLGALYLSLKDLYIGYEDEKSFVIFENTKSNALFNALKKAYERNPQIAPVAMQQLHNIQGEAIISYSLLKQKNDIQKYYLSCQKTLKSLKTRQKDYFVRCIFYIYD